MLAMVPFLGAASIWGERLLLALLLCWQYKCRIGLALYGFLYCVHLDNLIKPLVLHGQSNLHPLLALLSILGGVQTWGRLACWLVR